MAEAIYTAEATSTGGGRDGHVRSSSVDAAVGIGRDDTSLAISVALTAHLPGLDQATADDLVEAAHQLCPYSKATRGNVDVQLSATV